MITLTKSGNAIVFTFDDNDHYLNDGTIEVPVNSLTLVTDESQMATFRKSASNDIFISATYNELGMSKSDLESWFKENACGSTGGGGGVTSGDVQAMIDESISGKADTSDVQNVASDVATVSGDVNTLSGSVESNHNAITALNGDVSSLSGDVANKADTTAVTASINSAVSGKMDTSVFNTYSASTDARISEDEEVTSAALNELNDALDDKADTSAVTESINAAVSGKADTSAVTASITAAVSGKQDTLIAGSGITIDSANTISCTVEGGTVDQAFDRDSTNAIANSAVTRNTIGSYDMTWSGGKSFLQAYDQKGYGLNKLSLGFSKINGRDIAQVQRNIGLLTNFDLVETSAITSSVTSSSTDSEIPSAKAVYDALQEGGGGGLPESAFTAYTASTEARLAEDEEVTAAGLNVLNEALSGKQDTLSAGTNITISGNVISAEGGGKTISGGTNISVTTGETADTVNCTLPISHNGEAISIGTSNLGSSSRSVAIGDSNTLNTFASNSLVGGQRSAINYNCGNSIAFGYETNVRSKFSFAFGTYARTSNQNEFSTGIYNNSVSGSTTADNTLFSVGNGTAENARHNAFEIRQNGDIYVNDGTNDVRLQDTILALGGLKLVQISQSDYDLLPTKDPNTLYIITNVVS